jgi:hypothetical protein
MDCAKYCNESLIMSKLVEEERGAGSVRQVVLPEVSVVAQVTLFPWFRRNFI